MVGRATRRRRTRGHDAMATKAARQPHERHMVDVGTARGRGGGDAGEASSGDGIVKGIKDIGSSARRQGAEEVANRAGLQDVVSPHEAEEAPPRTADRF